MSRKVEEEVPLECDDALGDGTIEDLSRRLTIPNLLTGFRLIGSVGLVVLAVIGQTELFVYVFLIFVFTDWIDGKIARSWHQRTVLGARLDSFADATLFTCLLVGSLLLIRDELVANIFWIAAAVLSYAATTLAGIWKYGRWPAYHTWAAKTSWYFMVAAVTSSFLDWSPWPLRIAMMVVTLTNLEAIALTLTLRHWHADVPSWFHARKIGKAGEDSLNLDESGRSA